MFKLAIVDDSDSLVTLASHEISKRLNKSGIRKRVEILEFTDPVMFIDAIKTNSMDLVLLDYDMPKLNGIEVGKRLLEIAPSTQFIFVVSNVDQALQDFFRNNQVTAIMPKDDLFFDNIARFIHLIRSSSSLKVKNETLLTALTALAFLFFIGAYSCMK